MNLTGTDPVLSNCTGITTTNTVKYTPRQLERLFGAKPLCVPATQKLEIRRVVGDACDYCGCLLPEEYRPNCSQCGGPITARRPKRPNSKWTVSEGAVRYPGLGDKPDGGLSVRDQLDYTSRICRAAGAL